MLEIRYGERNSKKLKWGGIAVALVMLCSGAIGIVRARKTQALEGDPANWTVENDAGLSLTITTVRQNEVELAPQWSPYIYNEDTGEFGGYYFRTANNSDKLMVGVMVEGMVENESYTVFDDQTITAEDNGRELFVERTPSVYMEDSTVCEMVHGEQECRITPNANEYNVSVSVRKTNDWSSGIYRRLIVRPQSVGSRNIEVLSVKQNGTDVYLDTVGRQVTTWEELENTLQTINEYRLDSYTAPVEVKFRLKNLEIGKRYSFDVGMHYESFKADATTKEFTLELELDYTHKHIGVTIVVYNSESYMDNDRVPLYFRVADPSFVPLGDIIIDEIEQNEAPLNPSEVVSSYQREYTFAANDVQPVNIHLHAIRATAGINYYISYSMHSSGAYIPTRGSVMVSGEELEGGMVLPIASGYGLVENSPVTLSITVSAARADVYGSSSVFYNKDYDPSFYNPDVVLLNYFEDAELPRYSAAIGYANSEEEVSDVINARYHDAEHPLWIKINGERYDNNKQYEIRAKVATGENDDYYSATFVATGAELNAGKTFVLDGLVLQLPEFDPSGNSSGYEMSYEFSLEIDGLEQRGTMYYMYNGYIYTIMTYAGGKVAASGDGIGMGGAMYMASSIFTVRKSSLDGSRNAVLHYRGEGFDEDLSYNYALYYNENAGNEWWSAPAGTKIEEGVMPGSALNSDGLSINVAVPDGASDSSMYSLVITRNGRLVIVSKDFLQFTDAPQVESFAFRADENSFMQMGSTSYRLARGADATAILTGAGFDDAAEYRLWVTYRGYGTEENEWGYADEVDLGQMNRAIVVTGAPLNAGYSYEMAYTEALDDVGHIEVFFQVTDIDGERPDFYSEERDWYSGHVIIVNFVNEDEVFKEEGGFQIDEETSEIIDVCQPDDGIPVDIRTPEDVQIHTEGDTLVMVSSKPSLVIGLRNGHYELAEMVSTIDDDGVKTNSYDISGFEEVKVVLKGDGDMDGAVTPADLNRLNRSLISPTVGVRYRALTDIEKVIFDFDYDGNTTPADLNTLNRSLISPTAVPRYRAIQW